MWFASLPARLRVLIICTLAALVLVALGIFLFLQAAKPTPEPVVEEQPVVSNGEPLPTTIEVVDTPAKRSQGLSGRSEVPDDYGMLFVFDIDGKHGFWMKDMQVPIDIIWLSEEGTIVHVEHSLTPETYPKVFTPLNPARYALETKAGYARKHNWGLGVKLDITAYK